MKALADAGHVKEDIKMNTRNARALRADLEALDQTMQEW